MRHCWLIPGVCIALTIGCGGGSSEDPVPVTGFSMLSGQTVLVLPVQFVQQVPGGWIGRSRNASDAARMADTEITFALNEQGGRADWITPNIQELTLTRRPGIEVDPYSLSAGEARQKGGNLKDVKDPLYGEIRVLAALFDCRYVLWPMEVYYQTEKETSTGQLAIRTFVLDARRGDVLWYGVIPGDSEEPAASPAALAALAQRFAVFVSP